MAVGICQKLCMEAIARRRSVQGVSKEYKLSYRKLCRHRDK